MAAMFRKWPKANGQFLERRVEAHWQEYEPDARLVMATINQLVTQEEFEDSTANLPAMCDIFRTVQ
jgi:hypothetical protein